MKAEEIDLQAALEFRPEEGKLLLSGRRMVIFSQASLGILQKVIRGHFGETYYQALFAQFGQQCGRDDFASIAKSGTWDSEVDLVSSGPVTHMWEGIVHVQPTALEYDRHTGAFHMSGEWRNSYEAENYLRNFGSAQAPVCFSLTGYASGWASAFMNDDMVAIERSCIACGDSHCTFEIKPRKAWGDEASPWLEALDATTDSVSNYLEAEVSRRTNELTLANMELGLAKDRAEEANAAKSQFVAKLSHELRTPMNGVMGLAQLLQESGLSNEQAHWVELIMASAKQQVQIVSDLLDFSKLEAGKMQMERAPFEPNKLCAAFKYQFGGMAQNKGLRFEVEHAGGMPANLVGDATKINQVLINLLSNSIKFTQEGSVGLRGWYAEGLLHFEVQDTGIGISPEVLQNLFSPFYQADGSISRRFGGTGLGLAITKELIELMQGTIEVESELGTGSTFRVAIPCPAVPVAAPSDAPADLGAGATRFDGARALVCEDNPVNMLIIKRFLRSLGVEVTTACDGLEGIEKFKPGAFDIIFMDLHMPRCDGFGATREIRKADRSIPIIAATADLASKKDLIAQKGHFNGFMPKPYTKEELVRVLKARLQRALAQAVG